MIQVDAPSRIHFGLLSLRPDAPRRFGGAGAMIARPGLRLRIEPAEGVVADGPLAQRAARYARTLLASPELDLPLSGVRITVVSAPPEHVGLGTGTQLAFAVARGLLALTGDESPSTRTLARILGRGKRSAIGLHGFAHGGLLVDAGKAHDNGIAPIVSRVPLCPDWRFVLVIPRALRGMHGSQEARVFAHLPALPTETTDALCRVVLLGLLPAAAEQDIDRFGEAVYELNRRVGECFADAQGGTYADPLLADIVRFLRTQNITGVGQSSWGPALFAVTDEPLRAEALVRTARHRFSLASDEIFISVPASAGANIETLPASARDSMHQVEASHMLPNARQA